MDLDHKHIIVTASNLSAAPVTAEAVNEWLTELVSLVGMTILIEPQSKRCDTPGNEGVTGFVCIETSHASLHCWDGGADDTFKAFLKMDLYSCVAFDPMIVINHIKKFKPDDIRWIVVDRNDSPMIFEGAYDSPGPRVIQTGASD